MKTLDEYTALVSKLEPKLKQTVWPPMTYMMIPSVLDAADKLLLELDGLKETSAAHMALYQKLAALRSDFKREA